MYQSSLAAFDPEILAPLILGVGVFVVVPVVAMLLKHQRAMAELLNRNEGVNAANEDRMRRMESELAVIKDRLNTQILHTDATQSELPKRMGDKVQPG